MNMMINYLPQEGLPFGSNIHLVYSLKKQELLFLHNSFQWIMNGEVPGKLSTAISKIEQEDVSFLSQVLTNVLDGKFNGKITFKLRTMDGHRWLQATPFLGDLEGERILISTIIDVTDEIINQQSFEKFSNKKNSILHMLGHDLRGPLNLAKSVMKIVDREISDPTLLKKTEYIATILQQSINMISDLINREFLETANSELVKLRVNIVQKLDEYIEECRRSESVTAIDFQLHASSDKIFISLDEAKFMQIVNNLISNSLKFTPSGGQISVSIEEKQGEVEFRFSDTGIGIPESALPVIFDKFTSAKRPGLRGEPTVGLGLSIVKTIVDWHNGKISCESKEGSGTTFRLLLPTNLPEQVK
jgi:two-component system sensor histidine kinase VicK